MLVDEKVTILLDDFITYLLWTRHHSKFWVDSSEQKRKSLCPHAAFILVAGRQEPNRLSTNAVVLEDGECHGDQRKEGKECGQFKVLPVQRSRGRRPWRGDDEPAVLRGSLGAGLGRQEEEPVQVLRSTCVWRVGGPAWRWIWWDGARRDATRRDATWKTELS